MKAFRIAVIVLLAIIAGGVWALVLNLRTRSVDSAKQSQTYETVMPDGKKYRIQGPKGQTDVDVQREISHQIPASVLPANMPHEMTLQEFSERIDPHSDKPVAIAPPCKNEQARCSPEDRMWDQFPGKLEPGDLMTPNGFIYRPKH